jgi:hypothetical protein
MTSLGPLAARPLPAAPSGCSSDSPDKARPLAAGERGESKEGLAARAASAARATLAVAALADLALAAGQGRAKVVAAVAWAVTVRIGRDLEPLATRAPAGSSGVSVRVRGRQGLLLPRPRARSPFLPAPAGAARLRGLSLLAPAKQQGWRPRALRDAPAGAPRQPRTAPAGAARPRPRARGERRAAPRQRYLQAPGRARGRGRRARGRCAGQGLAPRARLRAPAEGSASGRSDRDLGRRRTHLARAGCQGAALAPPRGQRPTEQPLTAPTQRRPPEGRGVKPAQQKSQPRQNKRAHQED